jgi:hypothetical protein
LPIALHTLIYESDVDPIFIGNFPKSLHTLLFTSYVCVDLTSTKLAESLRVLQMGAPIYYANQTHHANQINEARMLDQAFDLLTNGGFGQRNAIAPDYPHLGNVTFDRILSKNYYNMPQSFGILCITVYSR